MKKIFAILMSFTIIASVSSQVFADDTSRVIVTTSKTNQTVSSTYPAGKENNVISSDITALMTQLSNLTSTKDVVQDLTISSSSAAGLPVEIALKLELPENSNKNTSSQYSAIDYYEIKITDANGNVVYDDTEANAETGADEKVVVLGTYNTDGKDLDIRYYDICISANDSVNTSSLTYKPSDVKWSLSITDDESLFSTSDEPIFGVSSDDTPSSTDSKRIVIECTNKETSDNTVHPGSYRMIGSGHILVLDADGDKKYEFDLAAESKTTTTLSEGDTVILTGGSNSHVQFKSSTTSSPTPTPTSSTPSATVRPTASPKTNPKTGDNTPLTVVIMLAAFAFGAIGYVGFSASKNKSK